MAAGLAGAKEMSTVVALVAILSEPCGVCTSKEEQRVPTKAFLYKWCFCFMLKWLYQELAAAARYDVRLNLALGTIEALELEHRSWTSSRNLRTTASSPAPITTADGSAGLLGGGEEGWEPWWEFLLSCCKSHQQRLVPGSIDSICQTEIIPRTPPPRTPQLPLPSYLPSLHTHTNAVASIVVILCCAKRQNDNFHPCQEMRKGMHSPTVL